MSNEPAYFAIVRTHGRDSPRRFHEIVQRCYADKSRRGELVYCTRLDNLPDAETLIAVPLARLMQRFCAADDRGSVMP